MIKKKSELFMPSFAELIDWSALSDKPHLKLALDLPNRILLGWCSSQEMFRGVNHEIVSALQSASQMQSVFKKTTYYPYTSVEVTIELFKKGPKKSPLLVLTGTVTSRCALRFVNLRIHDEEGMRLYKISD